MEEEKKSSNPFAKTILSEGKGTEFPQNGQKIQSK